MTEALGRVTISQDVLNTIVRLTTLGVEGVSRLEKRPGRRHGAEGFHVEVSDNQARVDVYVILKPDTNLRDVGRDIQAKIARSLQEMVGMPAASVNVHIQDVEALAGQ
ncbi:MAG TPA: Asp23/Gls24 family envelope stress response protein [Anaerolineae bacterium]|nr:Asp23/Gls24 family envelope stress response protein [Anaerolineae bacterium]